MSGETIQVFDQRFGWRCRCGAQSADVHPSLSEATQVLKAHQESQSCRYLHPRGQDLVRIAV